MKKQSETNDAPIDGYLAVNGSFQLLSPLKRRCPGCLNCGYTESKLQMRTRLHNGFGGWSITKNGAFYFAEDARLEYDECRTLSYIERRAKLEPDCDWRANLDLPLRSAVYQRQGKSKWMLVERGQGFA